MRASILIVILLPFSACATPLPVDIEHSFQRRGVTVVESPGLESVTTKPTSSASRLAVGKTHLDSEAPVSPKSYIPGLPSNPDDIPPALLLQPAESKGPSWMQAWRNAWTRHSLDFQLLKSQYKQARVDGDKKSPLLPWFPRERYLNLLSGENTEVWRKKNAAAVEDTKKYIQEENHFIDLSEQFEKNEQKGRASRSRMVDRRRKYLAKQRAKIWGNAAKNKYMEDWIANEKAKLARKKQTKSGPVSGIGAGDITSTTP